MRKLLRTIIAVISLLVFASNGQAQVSDRPSEVTQKKYQAKAPPTQPFGKEGFASSNATTIRWLGMAGFLINSRGTTIMVDPLLKGFDMPLLLCHWGSVDAPEFAPFNGDPEKLKKAIINPERIHVLAPGQPYTLTKLKRL